MEELDDTTQQAFTLYFLQYNYMLSSGTVKIHLPKGWAYYCLSAALEKNFSPLQKADLTQTEM